MSTKVNKINDILVFIHDDTTVTQAFDVIKSVKVGNPKSKVRGPLYQAMKPKEFECTVSALKRSDNNKLTEILTNPLSEKGIDVSIFHIGKMSTYLKNVQILDSPSHINITKFKCSFIIKGLQWYATVNYKYKMKVILRKEKKSFLNSVQKAIDSIRKFRLDTFKLIHKGLRIQELEKMRLLVSVIKDAMDVLSFLKPVTTTLKGKITSMEYFFKDIEDLFASPVEFANDLLAIIEGTEDLELKANEIIPNVKRSYVNFFKSLFPVDEDELKKRKVKIEGFIKKDLAINQTFADVGNRIQLLGLLKNVMTTTEKQSEEFLEKVKKQIRKLYNVLPDEDLEKFEKMDTIVRFINEKDKHRYKRKCYDRITTIYRILYDEYGHLDYLPLIIKENDIQELNYFKGELKIIDESRS